MNLSTSFGVSMITGLFDTDPNSPMSIKKRAPFELRVGPFVNFELEVLSFRGTERVSDVYRYEVTFATLVDQDTLHTSLFGEPACLSIKSPGYDPRVIQGIAISLEALGGVPGEQSTGRLRYRLEIVPKLWLMKQRRKNRVFQQKSTPEIVNALLAEVGMEASESQWRAEATDYPPLPFVYQRNESDFAFLRRILADAGIFFYFVHSSGLLAALMPGAGVSASASASVSLGGISVSAGVSAGVALTSGATVLNFAALASNTPSISGAAGAAPAADASVSVPGGSLSVSVPDVSVSVGLGGISASVGTGLAGPSDTVFFDDGMGAAPDDDRIYEFGLKKLVRTKSLRLQERIVDASTNWVGEQTEPTATAAATVSASLTPSVSVSVGLGGISASVSAGASPGVPFDLDTPLVTSTVLRQERYQVDASLPLSTKAGSLDNPRMQMELARTRRRFLEAEGKGDCRRMAAGYRFTLAGHPIAALNQEYTIVALDTAGTHPDYAKDAEHVYRNRFRCIPATDAPIPARPKRRPKLGIELAQVVAFSDITQVPFLESSPNGYVKVRFRWDIVDKGGASTGMLQNAVAHPSGTQDDASVWVPVMQPWAGAGYGTQFIPREGMEVVVGFLEDQGERPVILGCMYNTVNAPPWPGPSDQQKVGLKSQTRAANGGYSEVSIDDRQGKELVTIRAQTDMNETVLANQSISVGGNRTLVISGDEQIAVTGSRKTTVNGSNTETIKQNHTLSFGGDCSTGVAGNRSQTVAGNAMDKITGLEHRTIDGSAYLSVGGSYTVSSVGPATTIVGTQRQPVSSYSTVWGQQTLSTSDTLVLRAPTSITLECGTSTIVMTPGDITLEADTIVVSGRQSASLFGKSPFLHLTDTVSMASDTIALAANGASLKLGSSTASLLGSSVKLGSNSGSSSSSSPPSSSNTLPFSLQLSDPSFKPYANLPYDLTASGKEFHATTDGQGFVTQQLPPDATKVEITLWLTPAPTGLQKRWVVDLVATVPPATDVAGAQTRLKNIGYYLGDADGTLSPALVEAITAFQLDNKLPGTGELDGPTADALSKAHGH